MLRDDLVEAAEMCMATHAVSLSGEQLLLYIEIGTQNGEAFIESVSYDQGSNVTDPRLLKCLYELVENEVLPAEVLDVVQNGVLRVSLD